MNENTVRTDSQDYGADEILCTSKITLVYKTTRFTSEIITLFRVSPQFPPAGASTAWSLAPLRIRRSRCSRRCAYSRTNRRSPQQRGSSAPLHVWLLEITGTHPSKAKENQKLIEYSASILTYLPFLKGLVFACKEDAANATTAANSDFKSSIFILYCFLKFIRNIKSMGEQKKTPHKCATLLSTAILSKIRSCGDT